MTKGLFDSPEDPPRQFQSALDFIAKVYSENPKSVRKVIKAFALNIQAPLLTACILDPDGEQNDIYFDHLFKKPKEDFPVTFFNSAGYHKKDLISEFWAYVRKIEGNWVLDLSKDCVFPWPWNSGRYYSCLGSIGAGVGKNPWKQDYNHRIDFFWPMGLGFVDGGNHSISSGILGCEGKIQIDHLYDMKALYEHYKCDGKFVYDLKTSKPIQKIGSFWLALIYEAARFIKDDPFPEEK